LLVEGVSMSIKKTARLISEQAVCKMLQLNLSDLLKLCNDGKLSRFKTSDSLYQYDFNQIVELRKLNIKAPCGDSKPVVPPVNIPAAALTQTNEDMQLKIAKSFILEKKIQKEMRLNGYRKIESSAILFLSQCPLYVNAGADTYTLYKPAGERIAKAKIDARALPDLYIAESSWQIAFKEMQAGLIEQLNLLVDTDQVGYVKSTIVSLLDILLYEQDFEVIEGLEDVVEVLIRATTKKQGLVLNMVPLLEKDAGLGLHSARIMALSLKFCFKNSYSVNDSKLICISALLHDIGKTMLPDHLLSCNPKTLVDAQDIVAYQLHPQIGYILLEDCGIKNKIIDFGTLEHHERLDGSGFPKGKNKISFLGQIIGLVDAYDSIKNMPRPGVLIMSPIDSLKILKKDCDAGKFSKEIFESFIYSLL
jgi:HD-GYP domain-containing protein (c-di-GMP phosphodiesterase class II)